MDLNKIRQPVAKELIEAEEYFHLTMKSNVFLLDKVLNYIVKRKGKQMRPLFVMLVAALNGKINEKTYRVATMIELLHTATLVHDDVVDESLERRAAFSINALWKNKVAVLVGDYLLSRGMLLALKHKDYDLLEITSDAVKLMSEGELLQIQKARTLDIKEEVYFDVIRMKTASLFASSCSVGAASVDASEENVQRMWDFGNYCGIAFQIKDDLLDFNPQNSGKPKGADLKEKKMTLPLIFALQHADKSEKRQIINMIANPGKKKEVFEKVHLFISSKNGFDYAIEKMTFYKKSALELLEYYPDNDYKTSLIELVNFILERDR